GGPVPPAPRRRPRPGRRGGDAPRGEPVDGRTLPAPVRERRDLGPRGPDRRRPRARHRAAPGWPRGPAPDRRCAGRAPLMATVGQTLRQVVAITALNVRNVPRRLGASLVVVVGIAGVVGVLVAVLAMSTGFRHTLASTGRPGRVIMLRAGSDS